MGLFSELLEKAFQEGNLKGDLLPWDDSKKIIEKSTEDAKAEKSIDVYQNKEKAAIQFAKVAAIIENKMKTESTRFVGIMSLSKFPDFQEVVLQIASECSNLMPFPAGKNDPPVMIFDVFDLFRHPMKTGPQSSGAGPMNNGVITKGVLLVSVPKESRNLDESGLELVDLIEKERREHLQQRKLVLFPVFDVEKKRNIESTLKFCDFVIVLIKKGFDNWGALELGHVLLKKLGVNYYSFLLS